ncbi:MAG: patatin-like phospholipase family protein [Anaerolineales bacterium]|nr:patatin-like phospholipase family protein [Anaerolineales bacterium]
MPNPDRQPLTLAFGGGGVKSVACAGVLAVLEEAGLPIGPIVGVSGGGLVALLYGAGYSPLHIRKIFNEIELMDVWEPDPERKAIFGLTRLRARMEQYVGQRTFADLKHPVAVTAIDMYTERSVRLDSGLLVDAAQATMAIPGLFRGVERDGQLLMDGGMVSPLPLAEARALGGPVVAVDVLWHRSPDEFDHLFEGRGPMRYAGILTQRLGLDGIFNQGYHAATIMMRRLSEYALQLYPPDLLLRPETGRAGLFAFDLTGYVYEMGVVVTRAALPQLEALTQPRRPSAWKRIATHTREFWNRRIRRKRESSE